MEKLISALYELSLEDLHVLARENSTLKVKDTSMRNVSRQQLIANLLSFQTGGTSDQTYNIQQLSQEPILEEMFKYLSYNDIMNLFEAYPIVKNTVDKSPILQKIVRNSALVKLVAWIKESDPLSYKRLDTNTLDKLDELMLDENEFTNIPREIGFLTNLKELWLNNNKITSLPSEIGDLKNLRFLELSDNQLKRLPKEIGGLANLKQLWLDGNPLLKSLPKEIGALDLEYIDTQYEEQYEKLRQRFTHNSSIE